MERPLSFLIVRGDAAARQQTARELERAGRVVTASSCSEARDALRATTFDGLIVDAELFDGSGLALVDVATAHSPDICSFAFADAMDNETMTRALETGAHICSNPFSKRHGAVIDQAVRGAREVFERRVRMTLDRWKAIFHLTNVEEDLLRRAANGESRVEMARRRHVTAETVRKQAQTLLRKTKERTFDSAVIRLLREACGARN